MLPKSLSATSLSVAELCTARYKAEYIDYARSIQGNAANVGIVCHNTFEEYLRAVFIRKDHPWDEGKFWEYFEAAAREILGSDQTSEEYIDAKDLCRRWITTKNRQQDLEAVKILSLESKNNFLLKTSAGDMRVTYIMDRLDQIGEDTYRVVDYKSNRVGLTPGQLRKKLQARLYALMVQIKYPNAKEIWVQFEFLRHGQVEVLFTREDNVTMYRELQRRAEDIIGTPENRVKETLNPDCGYCVRKASCKTLLTHVAAGGILGKSPEELAEIYTALTNAEKARKTLLGEVEDQLLKYCIEEDLVEFEVPAGVIKVEMKSRRSVNSEAAAIILGQTGLDKEYQKFSVTDIDNILKKGLVVGPQAELLKATIIKTASEPAIKLDPSGY
jgi:RecB family exonuclease